MDRNYFDRVGMDTDRLTRLVRDVAAGRAIANGTVSERPDFWQRFASSALAVIVIEGSEVDAMYLDDLAKAAQCAANAIRAHNVKEGF